jgi:hypothetical protein
MPSLRANAAALGDCRNRVPSVTMRPADERGLRRCRAGFTCWSGARRYGLRSPLLLATIATTSPGPMPSGGENIYPAEVEAVLAQHPAVADVAVVARPDPTWGEGVHAVIIPATDSAATPEEIIAWCRERLAHFKCPKTAEFTSSLPRTTTGKVLKRELRAKLADQLVRAPQDGQAVQEVMP